MKLLLVAGLLITQTALADDYSEGRLFALNAQSGALSSMSQLPPGNYLNDYTNLPPESGLDPVYLNVIGQNAAATNETAQQILKDNREREKVVLDLNSEEMKHAGNAIDSAEEKVSQSQIPCADGQCLSTQDERADDFGEGVSRLGTLAGSSNEVSSYQIGSHNQSMFKGSNHRCRIAALHVGNCCSGHAHLLRCREEEKALSSAKLKGLAVFVGKYCAHRKLNSCTEHKESWCVFPSILATIIQFQGRFLQLGIPFGVAYHDSNKANCRGISPEELERINFQALDLSPLTLEFKSKATFRKDAQLADSATQKIGQMEQEGGSNDD